MAWISLPIANSCQAGNDYFVFTNIRIFGSGDELLKDIASIENVMNSFIERRYFKQDGSINKSYRGDPRNILDVSYKELDDSRYTSNNINRDVISERLVVVISQNISESNKFKIVDITRKSSQYSVFYSNEDYSKIVHLFQWFFLCIWINYFLKELSYYSEIKKMYIAPYIKRYYYLVFILLLLISFFLITNINTLSTILYYLLSRNIVNNAYRDLGFIFTQIQIGISNDETVFILWVLVNCVNSVVIKFIKLWR